MGFGNFWNTGAFGAGMFGGIMGFLFIPLMVWGLLWKGWALWKAARAQSKIWFVILLLVNTIGILDILYIFVFSKASKATKKNK